MNEKVPEIKSYWMATRLPDGNAPVGVRNQWVGVPLPLRYDHFGDKLVAIGHGVQRGVTDVRVTLDAVGIEVDDAVKALMIAGKVEAAAYWAGIMTMYRSPGLIFDADSGDLLDLRQVEEDKPNFSRFDEQEVPLLKVARVNQDVMHVACEDTVYEVLTSGVRRLTSYS